MPKKPNPRAALNLLPTYLGACKAISARTGEPCKRFVVHGDGFCRQHSPTKLGQDEKEAIEQRARELVKIEVAKFKEKRVRRAARKPKWREALSKICFQTAAAVSPSLAPETHAALAKSSGPRKARSAAATTAEHRPVHAQQKEKPAPSPALPALRHQKDELAPTSICSSAEQASSGGVPASSQQAKSERSSPQGEGSTSARTVECLPYWHPSAVPGERYTMERRLAQLYERRVSPEPLSPDARWVDPKVWQD